MAHPLTITLTDAPPIKIDRDLWPVLVSHSFKVPIPKEPRMGECWMKILQHADGRTIIYGCANIPGTPNERRFGTYLDREPSIDALIAAIKEVGAQIHPDLAQGCISKLPAVEV